MNHRIFNPTDQEIRERSFHYWEKRGGHGYDQVDWLNAKRMLFIEQNYDLTAQYEYVDRAKKVIGKPDDITDQSGRWCRFCRKAKSDGLTFGIKAHAIPESIGNKKLFSWNECDDCNRKTNDYETSFSDSIAIPLSLMLVRGKNGLKTYSSPSGLKINPSENQLQYGRHRHGRGDTDSKFHVDLNAGKIKTSEVNGKVTYPVKNFKLLTKCALSIMPEEHVQFFSRTADWIVSQDHANKPKGCEKLGAYYSHLPGNFISLKGSVSTYARKHPVNLPGYLFLIRIRNIAFQIALPRCDLDAHLDEATVPHIPAFPVFDAEKGSAWIEMIDMNSPEKVDVSFFAQHSFGLPKS